MLRVELFDPGQAHYCGQPLPGFPKQQCHQLLCYLLLNQRHTHHRERLAAVFWSDYSKPVSLKYLRNALWRLRCMLEAAGIPAGEYLSVADGTVFFQDFGPYWLDVEEFESTIAQLRDLAGHQLTPEQALSLEQALGLYSGDLLEGIYEDWCLVDRERLRMLHLDALRKFLDYCEHNGFYERGIAYGRRVLALDPTRERVHRRLMRFYWGQGDRSEALAQYHSCVQTLREELGILPTEETRRLHNLMASNRFDLAEWPGRADGMSLARARRDSSAHRLLEQTLERLQHLEAIVGGLRAELESVALLLNDTRVGAAEGG
jgi:DNA-binding SARP family transcriptional activator